MTLPVGRRPGRPVRRPLPTFGCEPVAAEFDEHFKRMNRCRKAPTPPHRVPCGGLAGDDAYVSGPRTDT
jgi:hypothetical protein